MRISLSSSNFVMKKQNHDGLVYVGLIGFDSDILEPDSSGVYTIGLDDETQYKTRLASEKRCGNEKHAFIRSGMHCCICVWLMFAHVQTNPYFYFHSIEVLL